MESKNDSIQLTRICITSTFPLGKKTIFFSKSAPGKISLSMVLVLHTLELGKTAKKPTVMSISPWIGRQTVVFESLNLTSQASNPASQASNPASQSSNPASQASNLASQASNPNSQASNLASQASNQLSMPQSISQSISQFISQFSPLTFQALIQLSQALS